MGPRVLVIKKGEHGALLMANDFLFTAPAFPIETLHDPTGAGDAFAGGFLGWIAKTDDQSAENLKRAVIYGNVMASFCIEKFSVDAIKNLTESDIRDRARTIHKLAQFTIE
jgi:sugar/nucleoside kinase (ribokinase family)